MLIRSDIVLSQRVEIFVGPVVEVSKRKDEGEKRVIRIEDEERMVAFAKHLVKMKIEAHKESLAENSDQEGQDDSEDPDLKVAANVLARIGNI